jgi:hypothetical protein
LFLDDIESGAQELAVANGGIEEYAVVEDALVVAFYGMVEVRPVDKDRDLLHRIWVIHSSHSVPHVTRKSGMSCRVRADGRAGCSV